MLYKYLFYSVSYLIKKYDYLWAFWGDTKDIYYLWGAMIVGAIIAFSILSLLDIIGIIFLKQALWCQFYVLAYLPISLGVLSLLIFRYKKRYDKIYEEVKNMDKKKKKTYKILNIIHIILVVGLYLSIKDIFYAIYG